ncbi:MAG TPA: DUF6328 family protein [Candidatus Angelobacter sp.]|jgi:hypothetical protein
MAKLSDRIENVLNEARMLLLGGQVLLGFSYRICFEEGFERISHPARMAEVTSLGIMTVGLGWLISPAAFHQIADHGRETERINRFTSRILDWGLLPFAAGLGLSFYPVSSALHLPSPIWIGAATCLFALAVWYGSLLSPENLRRQQKPESLVQKSQQRRQQEQADLSNRIKKVLIECRMALPGAQAFLGFQFAIVFAQGFAELPRSSQLIHFGSLIATTISIVLLIAPAAYHRLAERGQDTEHFHKVASSFLLASLVFLAPGMAGDLLVVIQKETGSVALSTWISLGVLLGFYALWFGVSLWKRRMRES